MRNEQIPVQMIYQRLAEFFWSLISEYRLQNALSAHAVHENYFCVRFGETVARIM